MFFTKLLNEVMVTKSPPQYQELTFMFKFIFTTYEVFGNQSRNALTQSFGGILKYGAILGKTCGDFLRF